MLSYILGLILLSSSPTPPPMPPLVVSEDIAVQGDRSFLLTVVPGKTLFLSADGTANGGDLDCYVVSKGRIIAQDTRMGSKCELTALPTKGLVVVWVQNNGVAVEHYTMTVKQ